MLRREVDRIPFAVYENKIASCRAERELRNDGMCIVERTPNFFVQSAPNCASKTTVAKKGTELVSETEIETNSGVLRLEVIDRGSKHNPWYVSRLFGGPADFPALKAYLGDLSYVESFEGVQERMDEGDGDLFLRGKLGYSPMQDLIYTYMGMEMFSYQWADNRNLVLELYEILREKYLDRARLGAGTPQLAVNICGNVTASVVSPAMFEEYYLPVYNEACELLHKGGRLCGAHFDGITLPYAKEIAESHLDYIEALTPPPTCDVTVAMAHELWPDKVIWTNFPSSTHLESEDTIRNVMRDMLAEGDPRKGFIVGITEDVPVDRWPVSFRIIVEEINRHNPGVGA